MDITTLFDVASLIVIFIVGIVLYGLVAILLMTIGVVFFYVLVSFLWKGFNSHDSH